MDPVFSRRPWFLNLFMAKKAHRLLRAVSQTEGERIILSDITNP